MKNLLFTSTLFLIVNFSFAQTKIQNDLTRDGLKGKVSFFSESKYDLVEKFGEIEKGSLSDKFTYKYDEKGNMIEVNYYNADESLGDKYTYKYDEKGNKIESIRYNADGSLRFKHTSNYEFDAMGNWIKKTSIPDGKPNLLTERVIEYYKTN